MRLPCSTPHSLCGRCSHLHLSQSISCVYSGQDKRLLNKEWIMRHKDIAGYILALLSNLVYAEPLITQIDNAIQKKLPHASVSILIKDAKNGQVLFSKDAQKLLYPASNIKLFTAAAALYYWPVDHTFTTELLQKQNDYYIRFGASPSLTIQNLNALLSDYFSAQHIHNIKGNIILDTSIFTPPYYPAGVSYDDIGWYYAAPDTAIILNENSAPYELNAPEQIGSLTRIKAKNNEIPLSIINEVIVVSSEEKKHCDLHIAPNQTNTIRLYGCVVASKTPRLLELAIPNPTLLAKQIITKILAQNNITFSGAINTQKTPEEAQLLATVRSKPLNKLIEHMLQHSNNLYADNLTKQLAYSLTKEGTNKQALFALKQILAQHVPLDMKQLDLADGIGTRYNMATTEQIAILLSTIYHDKNLYPLFIQALPQSGVSGTLKERMKKTSLEKIVYAKTGSMHDISSLSGFLINPNGRPIVFSIIINGINQPVFKAKQLEEEILTIINHEFNETEPNHSAFA